MKGKNDLTTDDLHIILNSPSIVSAIFKKKTRIKNFSKSLSGS